MTINCDTVDGKHANELTFNSSVRAFRTAALTHTLAGNWQKVALETKTGTGGWDTLGEFDEVTNYRFTALAAGTYQVNASIRFNTAAAGAGTIALFVNGAQRAQGSLSLISSAPGIVVSDIVVLAAGGYIELYGYQSSAGNLAYIVGAPYVNYLSIHRIA